MERIVIHPRQCLSIDVLQEDGSTRTFTTFLCRYLQAVDPITKAPVVAFEFLLDPKQQHPTAQYDTPHASIERQIIDPKRLQSVRPYLPVDA